MNLDWLIDEIRQTGGEKIVLFDTTRRRLASRLRPQPRIGMHGGFRSRYIAHRMADAIAEARLDSLIVTGQATGRIIVRDALPPILALGDLPPARPRDPGNGSKLLPGRARLHWLGGKR